METAAEDRTARLGYARDWTNATIRRAGGEVSAIALRRAAVVIGVHPDELQAAVVTLGVVTEGNGPHQRYRLDSLSPGKTPAAATHVSPSREPVSYTAAELLARSQRIAAAPEAKAFPEMAARLIVASGTTIEAALDLLRISAGKKPIYTSGNATKSSDTTTTAAPPRESFLEYFARRAREAQAHREGRPVETASPSQPCRPETSAEHFARRAREVDQHRAKSEPA